MADVRDNIVYTVVSKWQLYPSIKVEWKSIGWLTSLVLNCWVELEQRCQGIVDV